MSNQENPERKTEESTPTTSEEGAKETTDPTLTNGVEESPPEDSETSAEPEDLSEDSEDQESEAEEIKASDDEEDSAESPGQTSSPKGDNGSGEAGGVQDLLAEKKKAHENGNEKRRREIEALLEKKKKKHKEAPVPRAVMEAAKKRVSDLSEQVTERDEKIAELEQSSEDLQKERDEVHDRMLRVAADLENYRRRAERQQEELKRFGIDKVVLELIPAVDNMERALEHAESVEESSDSIVDGIRMVYRQILTALKKHGVTGFDAVSEKFDPERHEAIQQVETTEEETGTVMEEFQKGYFLHERLLRPALVSVAKRIEPPQDEESTQEDEEKTSEPEESGSGAEEISSTTSEDVAHEDEKASGDDEAQKEPPSTD